jgi:hypothetical protein
MKYLKTFESYSVSEEYSERQDMINMLVNDRDCVYSEEELKSMSDDELAYMCSSNESLKELGKKVLIKLGLMDKDEEVEARKEKLIANLEEMIFSVKTQRSFTDEHGKGKDTFHRKYNPNNNFDFTYDDEKVKNKEELVIKMAKNGFVGKLSLKTKAPNLIPKINYKPGAYKFGRLLNNLGIYTDGSFADYLAGIEEEEVEYKPKIFDPGNKPDWDRF